MDIGSVTDRFSRPWRGLRPQLRVFADLGLKLRKDNFRLLISVIAWNVLISVVPVLIGVVALTLLIFGGTTAEHDIILDLSRATRGVLQPHYIRSLVATTVKNAAIFWVLAIFGAVWAAGNIGFALRTCFSAVFEVGDRPLALRRLLELATFLLFAGLMAVILAESVAANAIDHAISSTPVSPVLAFGIHTAVSLSAAFLLFSTLYFVFPNTDPRLRFAAVWRGAATAAVLFQVSTYIWPLYEHTLSTYGGVVFPIIVLTVWIMFFSGLVLLGAEIVAVEAIRDTNRRHIPLGPSPGNATPQHRVLRRT